MLKSVRVSAPAKLNLSLRVLPRRADGYHDIESIFQKIDLCDELTLIPTDTGTCCLTVNGPKLPSENTVTAAFELFVKETGITNGVAVTLTKRIPSGAGMGGGSSDAAAMLRALDALFETNVSEAALYRMAENIGSDVPFFLGSSCALVSGRGERLMAIKARRDLCFVTVKPDVHSSTKEAYGLVDAWMASHEDAPFTHLDFGQLENEYRKPPKKWAFANSFTPPLASRYPEIAHALRAVSDTGADFVQMTGSGSVVFGVFGDKEKAMAAQKVLCKEFAACFVCEPYDEDESE